jgi:hypothetical protein
VSKATGVDPSNMGVWSNKTGQDVDRAMSANRMKLHEYTKSRKQGMKFQSAGFHSDKVGAAMCYDGDQADQSAVDADIVQFKRISIPLNAEVKCAVEDQSAVFAVTADNQVLSKGQTYTRPEWKSKTDQS